MEKAQVEVGPGISTERMRELAFAFADEIEKVTAANDPFSEFVGNAELTPEERAWAGEHLRWTVIDEWTGEDLLNE